MIDLRSVSRLAVALCVLSLVGATAAQAQLKKGDTLLLVQLTDGDVTLASPLSGNYISSYPQTEWGGGIQLQHLTSEDWALVVGGGIGTVKETNTPTPGSLDPVFVYKQTSWNVRFGGDRIVHITPRFHFFAGPGILYWTGHGSDEFQPGGTTDRPTVHRVALDGRMGAHVGLGEGFGLSGQLGRYLGHSTAKEAGGAKASWWSSGGTGQVGFFFKF